MTDLYITTRDVPTAGQDDWAAFSADHSAKDYWNDLQLYPKAEQARKLRQLEEDARRHQSGGSAQMLKALKRLGYVK